MIGWYYAPLMASGILFGVSGLWARYRLAVSASAMFANQLVCFAMAQQTGSQYDWACLAAFDWMAAIVPLLLFYGRSEALLAMTYLIQICAHLGYGVHEIEASGQAYDIVEYHAQLAYWWTTFAMALCQCAILAGWTGHGMGGGKRRPADRGLVRRRLHSG